MYLRFNHLRFTLVAILLMVYISNSFSQDTIVDLEQFEVIDYKASLFGRVLISSDSSLKYLNIDSVHFYQDTLRLKAYTYSNYSLMHTEEILFYPEGDKITAVFKNHMDIYKKLKELVIYSERKELFEFPEDSIMAKYNKTIILDEKSEILVNQYLNIFSTKIIRDRRSCSMPIYSIYWKSKKTTIKDYSQRWGVFEQLRDSLFLKEEYREKK